MLNFYTGNGKTLKIMLLFLNQLSISLPLLSSSSWTNTPSDCDQLCCHLGSGRGDFHFHLQTPGQAGAGGNTQEGKAERDTGRASPPWLPSLWGWQGELLSSLVMDKATNTTLMAGSEPGWRVLEGSLQCPLVLCLQAHLLAWSLRASPPFSYREL